MSPRVCLLGYLWSRDSSVLTQPAFTCSKLMMTWSLHYSVHSSMLRFLFLFTGYSSLSAFTGYSSLSAFTGYSSLSAFTGYSSLCIHRLFFTQCTLFPIGWEHKIFSDEKTLWNKDVNYLHCAYPFRTLLNVWSRAFCDNS